MRRFLLFFQIFRALWQARKSGDTDKATDQIMRAAGLGPTPLPPVASSESRLSETAQDLLRRPRWERLWRGDFMLEDRHVALIRAARLNWNGVESGAPELDLQMPFAGADALEILQVWHPHAGEAELVELLLDLPNALYAFIQSATLEPGRYAARNVDNDHIRDTMAGFSDVAPFGWNEDFSFDLAADDLVLMRAAVWQWLHEDEADAVMAAGGLPVPNVDSKRPYGNLSAYTLDVHRALGWPIESKTKDGFVKLSEAQEKEAMRLHFRQVAAMQIFFENAELG